MDEDQESREPVLAAHVHDVRQLATILRSVSFSSRATFTIEEAGFSVFAEEGRTLIARAYIPRSLFNEYNYVPEPQGPSQSQASESNENTMFEISLDTILECLNIFGTGSASVSHASFDNRKKKKKKKWKQDSDDEDEPERGGGHDRGKRGAAPNGNATIDQFFSSSSERRTGMHMSYFGIGHPLQLVLKEDAAGPTTTCLIQTMENETHTDLPFDDSLKVIKIILRSSWLRDALSELDPSCDKLTFIGTPPPEPLPDKSNVGTAKPTLRLSAEGTFGSTQMDYPNDREVLESFECAEVVKFTYRVEHVACALRALQSSTKTSLRIDEEGLLSLQFMMAGTQGVFVDFRVRTLSP